MKRITAVFIAMALVPAVTMAQVATPKSDQALIELAIENWNRAWQTKDAKLAAQDYSDDAD